MEQIVIRRCIEEDFEHILSVINDGARAYEGNIPPNCIHHPYMPAEDLRKEIVDKVDFWACVDGNNLLAVMGMQTKSDVVLIRHAYVRRESQTQGLGGRMIRHLRSLTDQPMLVGTWADAHWAIRFYEARGFHRVDTPTKELLLRKYWNVSERQIETSVVLADQQWLSSNEPVRRHYKPGSVHLRE